MVLLGVSAAWPCAVRAQPRLIGILVGFAESDEQAQVRVRRFREALAALGWKDGDTVQIATRWASGDKAKMEADAAELVALQPDVIFGVTVSAVTALLQATRTIPIVFAQVSDPVGSGLVSNVAHPGGNVTGFINFEESIAGKWPELLKEIAPATKRVAYLYNPETAAGRGEFYLRPFRAAAPALGVEPAAAPVHNEAEIRQALAALSRQAGGGLVVMPDAFTLVHRDLIIALAAADRVPTVYPFRFFTAAGGLMSYGVDPMEQYPLAAQYVDRILKGTNAADLPVQAPTTFELVINVKTATALGLDVPPTLLVRAEEVIE